MSLDGYSEMIESASWKSLRAAQEALFEAQRAFELEGLVESSGIFLTRYSLATTENQLRAYFKRKSEAL